ncbi:MAG: TIM44-like domain-containing protein [Clostridium sp.]|nr:TIM44-like domain-containing protein [Clostridium sp.]MCM1444735.1 TIM44-like domain-containing protein [Candidatus Amulumruptor caecigallinarius]
MNKLKKIFIILCLCVVYFDVSAIRTVNADSGFDSSWDSGSSWDSSSDWSSSSSEYYGTGDSSFGFLTFIIITVFIIVISLSSENNSKNNSSLGYNYSDIKNMLEIDPTLNLFEFKQNAFNIYKNIQYAWSELKDSEIRKYTTDELYNMYSMQLDTLRVKNQKNIMQNIVLKEAYLIDLKIENNIETATVIMKVNCKDYLIDSNNNVVRGNKNITNEYIYRLEYTRLYSSKSVDKCPHCGAPITNTNSTVCEYCNSTIVTNTSNWVLSKKQMLNQRVI